LAAPWRRHTSDDHQLLVGVAPVTFAVRAGATGWPALSDGVRAPAGNVVV
jgi:hypothetical protein